MRCGSASPHVMTRRIARWAIMSVAWLAGAHAASAQSVRGVVLQTAAPAPIADATVQLINSGDSVVATTRTDAQGRFLVRSTGRGRFTITVRKIGFAGGTSPVLDLVLDDTYEITLRLARLTELATREVIVDPKRPWLAGFAERRAEWFGSFLTAVDIRKMGLTATSDVLRSLAGVVIRTNADGHSTAWSSYGDKAGKPGPCELMVFTDGRIDDDGLTLTFVRPNDIEAIEVYAGAPKLPPGYTMHPQAVNCGAVFFWTRAWAKNGAKPKP